MAWACTKKQLWGVVCFSLVVSAIIYFVGNLNRDVPGEIPEATALNKEISAGTSLAEPESSSIATDSQKIVVEQDGELPDRVATTLRNALRGMLSLSPNTPPTLQEQKKLLEILFSVDTAMEDRRKAAWRLSRFADETICSQLKRFLMAPAQDSALKALIVEGLGSSTAPQAKELILYMLENGNVTEACGAVRGLAVRGSGKESALLTQMLSSPNTEPFVRDEIVEALGKIPGPESFSALTNLYKQAMVAGDADLTGQIINSLAQKDVSQRKVFFDSILSDPETDSEIRVAVAQALGAIEGERAPALVSLLSNSDANIRAEAAWGLIEMGQAPETVAAVLQTLENEHDPLVRKYLYEALAVQDVNTTIPSEMVSRIFNEEATDARVAGYLLLAKQMKNPQNREMSRLFDEQAVPELLHVALAGEKTSERIQAVNVLKQAGTGKATETLRIIVSNSRDPRVINASGVDLEKVLGE